MASGRGLAFALSLLLSALVARADVVLDGSFGQSGPVGHGEVVSGGEKFDVTHEITEEMGMRRGPNLFHSFSEFSLLFSSAGFSADPLAQTNNIIARVTGGRSTINGLIVVGPTDAQLYLVNPRGVVFGERAELHVPGSLHVSTAHYLRFADGQTLDMLNRGIGPLSSDPVAAFGFLDQSIQPIEPISVAQPMKPELGVLSVGTGGGLSFVGGDVAITGSGEFIGARTLEAPAGRIQLASAAGAIEIPTDLALLDPATQEQGTLGSITLSEFAILDSSGVKVPAAPSGSIVIRAGSFVLSSGRLRSSNPSGINATEPAIDVAARDEIRLGRDPELDPQPFSTRITSQSHQSQGVFPSSGGAIVLRADRVELVRQASDPVVRVESFAGLGPGGDIEVQARELIVDGALLRSVALSSGRGGDVRIDAETVNVTGAGSVLSTAPSSGQGGDVRIDAETVNVTGAGSVLSTADSEGSGGDIVITADAITLDGGVVRACVTEACHTKGGDTSATGQGGDVIIDTGSLTAVRGGQISASTLATERDGNAGRVQVTATGDVLLSGVREGVDPDPSGIFSRSGNLLIDSTGDAGEVSITARSLTLSDGATVSARTFGRGNAGNLVVHAAEFVRIQGRGPQEASLFSTRGDSGDSGNIDVITGKLEVLDGGQITASTNLDGAAGNIVIEADQLTIGGPNPNPTGIFAQSNAGATGPGGNIVIDLKTGGTLHLFDGGKISTQTLGTGDGGDATIEAGSVILERGSEISTRSLGVTDPGDAGDIRITAGYSLDLTDSEITAQAENSFGGNIEIQAAQLVNLLRSSITTSVALTGAVGDGGDISIDPQFVVLNQSSIEANAGGGGPGSIEIDAGQFVFSQDSVVRATNNLNVKGEIRITSPDTDLIGQITRLPSEFLDASALLASTCADPTGPAGSFVVRERGWIPASPDAPLGGFFPGPSP